MNVAILPAFFNKSQQFSGDFDLLTKDLHEFTLQFSDIVNKSSLISDNWQNICSLYYFAIFSH